MPHPIRTSRRPIRYAAAIGAFLVLATSEATAATEILPTRLVLSAAQSTDILNITNDRAVPASYEIKAFAWEQRPNGEIVLNPSEDIRATPAMVTVGPHETGQVSVEVTAAAPAAAEKTYRVSIRELEDRAKEDGEKIQVIATVTLPVFHQPPSLTHDGRVESGQLKNGSLPFAVKNTGNHHFFVETVSVTGTDAAGHTVFDISRNGWYVLAGGWRDFEAAISRKDCRRSRHIVVRAQLMNGGTWETPVAHAAARCGNGMKTEFPMPNADTKLSKLPPAALR